MKAIAIFAGAAWLLISLLKTYGTHNEYVWLLLLPLAFISTVLLLRD